VVRPQSELVDILGSAMGTISKRTFEALNIEFKKFGVFGRC
jgi:hypothetical protein